jgi:hypothetical protein
MTLLDGIAQLRHDIHRLSYDNTAMPTPIVSLMCCYTMPVEICTLVLLFLSPEENREAIQKARESDNNHALVLYKINTLDAYERQLAAAMKKARTKTFTMPPVGLGQHTHIYIHI